MPPARRKLPIGVQTFAKIRSEDYYSLPNSHPYMRMNQISIFLS